MPVRMDAPMLMGGNESYFPKIHIFEVRVSLRTSSIPTEECSHGWVSMYHVSHQ